MPGDSHTSNRNSSLSERQRHRTWLQQGDNFVVEFGAIHGADEIDKATLGAADIEACNQMTNANRQRF